MTVMLSPSQNAVQPYVMHLSPYAADTPLPVYKCASCCTYSFVPKASEAQPFPSTRLRNRRQSQVPLPVVSEIPFSPL
ncbi:rCG28429 [Rattus norvegicus]|uniref:DCM5 protein n=2 Tax=Rattus norvegicus TaxID=10116 RepID=M0R8T6_RAT|nr:DCM5 protein [Rattus norvegicus]EDL82173.1 rCG28429 [Rattus norvegicus]